MIKPNAQTDLDVARMLGWHTFTATSPEWRTQLRRQGIQCVLFTSDPVECRRYEGMRFVGNWHPTTDWDDAMKAAKRFLKLKEQENESLAFLSRINRETEATWFFRKLLGDGPLAICEAILAMVKTKEEE